MSLRYIQQACLSVVRPASEGSFANSMQAAAACPGLGRRNAYICPGGLQHAASAHRRRLKSTAVGQAAAGGSHELLDLDTVLSRVRQAVQGSNPLWKASANKNGTVYGEGVHMGLPVAWAFMWRPDGAWYEEVRSRHLTYKWGYDGAGNSWEVDPYGVSKVLEKDDHESSVLGALIRSGNWLVPELAAQHLVVDLEDTAGHTSGGQQSQPYLNMPPVAATWDVEPCQHTAAAAAAGLGPARTSNGRLAAACSTQAAYQQQQQQQQHQFKPDQQPLPDQQQQLLQISASSSNPAAAPMVVAAAAAAVEQAADGAGGVSEAWSRRRSKDKGSGDPVFVTIRLKEGRMIARVQISASTWRPVAYRQPFCSDTEAWVFEEWNNWTQAQQQQQRRMAGGSSSSSGSSSDAGVADVFYPSRVIHRLCKGVANSYNTHGGIARGVEVHTAYQLPVSPPVPIDVQYLETVSPQVPAWQTHQGHLLVQAHLNGRKAGWMLLDTGASGFVIEPKVAEEFRLPAFGDLSIAGIAGKVPTRFRRASQLRLGPLVLSDPVMLEMSISRIVGQFHEKVIGIVGYDVFRRCRITIPCHNTRKTIQKAVSRAGKVYIYSPEKDTPAAARQAAHPWPPTAAEQQQLAAMTTLQGSMAAVTAAAGSSGISGHVLTSAAAEVASTSQAVLHRRRRSTSSAGSSSGSSSPTPQSKRRRSRVPSARSSAATAAAASAPAVADHAHAVQQDRQQDEYEQGYQQPQPMEHLQSVLQLVSSTSSSSSQQPLLQLPPVTVPPPQYSSTDEPLPTALIEVLLHKPVMRAPNQFEDGYIWQDIVMIASLPHVELEFVVPGRPNTRHKSLFLVDSGAGGAEVMFHSRASRELNLLDHDDQQYRGWGEGLAEYRTVSGVGLNGADHPTSPAPSSSSSQKQQQQPPPAAATTSGVGCQAGKLPELVIRGQAGSDPATQGALQLKGVRALFNRSGGLDISLYSAGMVCADLLSRMQVVFDYPNKRIGWKVPSPGALAQLHEQEQQHSHRP